MSAYDENRFRPKPGRIRSDTPKAGKGQELFRAGQEDRLTASRYPVSTTSSAARTRVSCRADRFRGSWKR